MSARFALDLPDVAYVRDGNPRPIAREIRAGQAITATPRDIRGLVDLYDDEIAYLDEELGQLFAMIDARGLRERTLVILAADHGEHFLEHGYVGHCRQLFDVVVRTPLLVWPPGASSGRRSDASVANLDIAPTILDYLGIEAPRTFYGRTLRPLIEGSEQPSHRLTFATMGTLSAASDGRFKLIRDIATGEEQLYDRRADPGETVDRLADFRAEQARLAPALTDWIHEQHLDTPARAMKRANEYEMKLRALGYIE